MLNGFWIFDRSLIFFKEKNAKELQYSEKQTDKMQFIPKLQNFAFSNLIKLFV